MILAFLSLLGAVVADTVGGTGCTSSNCVFSNAYLRFGTGQQNSVNNWGLFVQPWYYSQSARQWYQLTFSSYPLDTAIGTGTSGPNWSRATVSDLYSLTPSNIITDYSEFIVSSTDSSKTVGYGKIVATRTFTVFGQAVILKNTFSLGFNDSFVKITSQVTNNATTPVSNMMMWVGTRDDYVGTTDSNTKTRGNLDTGSFVAVTTNMQSSRAIMITNTNEGVLFYSETAGVMTAYALCCSFSNVYNTYPLSLPPMTPNPTDGSYAAVLPLGNLSVGASSSITWYYAAGAIQSLGAVAETVAAAQVTDAIASAPVPVVMNISASAQPGSASRFSSSTVSAWPGSASAWPGSASAGPMSLSATGFNSYTVSAWPGTATVFNSYTVSAGPVSMNASLSSSITYSSLSFPTRRQARSSRASRSVAESPSVSASSSITSDSSPSVQATETSSITRTPTRTPSETTSQTPSQTPSFTPTQTPSPTPAPTAIVIHAITIVNNTRDFITLVGDSNSWILYAFIPLYAGMVCGICLTCIVVLRRRGKRETVLKIREAWAPATNHQTSDSQGHFQIASS